MKKMLPFFRVLQAFGLALFLQPFTASAQQAVSLMQPGQPALGWSFDNGAEFPGAKGGVEVDTTVKQGGQDSLKLRGDFKGGGNYVQASTNLNADDIPDIRELSFWMKGLKTDHITIRLIDATGRCHQFNLRTEAKEDWQRIVFPVEQFFAKQGQADAPTIVSKYEAWGGGSDGKWTGPAKLMVIIIGKTPENLEPTLWINNVAVVPLLPGGKGAPAWNYTFENDSSLPATWKAEGVVSVAEGDAFKGKRSLLLEKKDSSSNDKTSVAGPAFPVSAGPWDIQLAGKTDLTSMDNSYNGSVALEVLDKGGNSLGLTLIYEQFRKSNWQAVKKQVEIPATATSARFVARINKETPGKFWLDELSASPVAAVAKDNRIKRIMFTTAQLGNLLLPTDSRQVTMEVWSSKPLEETMKTAQVTVRDYWGAEQAAPLKVTLAEAGKKDAFFKYEGKADLAAIALEIGRYYEVHAAIAREGDEPVTNYTSLAILPEAPTNAYKSEEVPFTSRNWDNRLEDYVKLTHRLGIRVCGIWGKMEADMSKVEAPRLDLSTQLGMDYLTGSPAFAVEQRSANWKELMANDGELMRKAVRNYFEKYKNRPVIVSLGNEPHSKGDAAKVDTEAYKIVYNEIKKIDPSIFVVGTSVGVEEDYFKAGFGEWCDAYDFHVYEDATSVRNIVSKKYPEMFKKYGHPKPIWSTELGLNSQGMARQFVAAELYRKFANFFAGGGVNVSWFGLLYPDDEGKSAASSGSAHNVFDCRYNKYAPKLDAIAYYNAVNAIAIKKFVQDKVYGEDIHGFLFRDRDNKSLQLWYKDKGREDLFVPMPGVQEVQVIRIDGTRSVLQAGGKGLTLTVNEDPFLLLYNGGDKTLPDQPGAPVASVGALKAIVRGMPSNLDIVLNGIPATQASLKTPPLWEVKSSAAKDAEGHEVARYSLGVPEETNVREADLIVTLKGSDGKPNGELSLRPPVTGAISMQLLPMPLVEGKPVSVKLQVQNNSATKQQVSWDVVLKGEQGLKDGSFTPVAATQAYFSDTPSGAMELEGKKSTEVILPFADVDLYKVYQARATVRDASGRTTAQERPLSAFYGVPKAKKTIVPDGVLDEESWKDAPVRKLDKPYQFYAFPVKEKPVATLKDGSDLSAEIRYLWDDQYFYVSVKVTDDLTGPLQQDSELWRQDGLQFLVDPMRTSEQKIGKYDYAVGLGKKGPQAWCFLSADGAAPAGDAKDIKVAIKKTKDGTNDLVYEIAFPWSRLAPFKPVQGGNLGFTLIVNEDDGNGRDSFMTWFGNAHSKDIDTVGDLILLP